MKLITQEQRIPPSRGVITACNRWGKTFAPIDLSRWLRYNRIAFRTDKIDVLDPSPDCRALVSLFGRAQDLHIALSLRTPVTHEPPYLPALKDQGLHDVLLCPATLKEPWLNEWLSACLNAEIPLRLQLQAPFDDSVDVHAEATRFADAGVRAVNLVLSDPLGVERAASDRLESEITVRIMQEFAQALETQEVEANILQVPLCLLDEEPLIRAGNSQQCALDHQQYVHFSHEMATLIFRRRPLVMNRIMLILLARRTLHISKIDNLLLPWLLFHRYTHLLFGTWRRLTWKLNLFRGVPEPRSESEYENQLAKAKRKEKKVIGGPCAKCRLRRICDHDSKTFRQTLPGVNLRPQDGSPVTYPLHFSVRQLKYYDAIDWIRLRDEEGKRPLVEAAKVCTASRAPDRIIGSEGYEVLNTYSQPMEGGIKWYSATRSEKHSTPIARLEPPFTIAVDFGGGMAEYIGFSCGRRARIVCPMEVYRHTITLHVEADGSYVLLRDDEPVRPVDFSDHYYVPPRLGAVVSPFISIWNIEEVITTHNIRIWEHRPEPAPDLEIIKYSVLVVCTRFTRRLQCVLRNIAHQRDFDLRKIEIIVCYVPGFDATDDLLDSFNASYPEIRVVRSPFPEQKATAKGFLINESFPMASGEWIMLLDADTLLPPDMFKRIDEVSGRTEFIAPDGRKLLTRETTAKILMGEIDPWEQWEELLDGAGPYRHREAKGVPVGFCQCFKAKYLKESPYFELESFEWADMLFGRKLRELAGREYRLSGTPVMHLDHGSSQWFGTPKHL